MGEFSVPRSILETANYPPSQNTTFPIMSQKKRDPDHDDENNGDHPILENTNNSPLHEDKRRRSVPPLKNKVLEFGPLHIVQHLVEPMIRKVVREEVELALTKHVTSIKRNHGKEAKKLTSRSEQIIIRSLHLKFVNNLSLPVFTGSRIEAIESSVFKVALLDTLTGRFVDQGPESTAKVEIVVLEGDFEEDNWTMEEFKNNIVREREGKKPLLTGDSVFLNLKDGIGLINEISFTDNSSWTRSRKFKLGAMVVEEINGVRIREAKSEAFIVRDHRGELYKKHHPPSLYDEVWRLEKIGKDGAFHKRLSQQNVNTVKDFLTLLFIDPPRLRNILGTGMSAKMWEVTEEHARTCVMDKRRFLYNSISSSSSQETKGVVFNAVGEVLGLLSDCSYALIDKLSELEKFDAWNLVISAFQNWDKVLCFEDESSLLNYSLCSTSSSPMAEQGSTVHTRPDALSPDIISILYSIPGPQTADSTGLTFGQFLGFENQPEHLLCDINPFNQAFFEQDHLNYFDIDLHCNFSFETQTEVTEAQSSGCAYYYLWQRARTRWAKLFSIMKWFSIRRIVADRRRRANPIMQIFSCEKL